MKNPRYRGVLCLLKRPRPRSAHQPASAPTTTSAASPGPRPESRSACVPASPLRGREPLPIRPVRNHPARSAVAQLAWDPRRRPDRQGAAALPEGGLREVRQPQLARARPPEAGRVRFHSPRRRGEPTRSRHFDRGAGRLHLLRPRQRRSSCRRRWDVSASGNVPGAGRVTRLAAQWGGLGRLKINVPELPAGSNSIREALSRDALKRDNGRRRC